MLVQNMTSAKGNKIANQFTIEDGNKNHFQSYDSLIATVDHDNGSLTLYKDAFYSRTTAKYLRQWLFENCYSERVPAILKEAKKALETADIYTTTDF